MKRLIGIVCFCFVSLAVFGQSRDDVVVYVAPTTGGTAEERAFFDENIKMEVKGANYNLVDVEHDADYTIKMNISQEEDWDDPTVMINVFLMVLIDNTDGHEVIQFSWEYQEVEEMYQWNLYLVYQALANVPMTKLTAVPDSNHWRNKWLYVTAYALADFQFGFFDKKLLETSTSANRSPYTFYLSPAISLALEFQFLHFMSAEAGFVGAQQDFGGTGISGMRFALPLMLKFPLKPSKHFMLEPYLGLQFNMPVASANIDTSIFAWLVGFQYGTRATDRGALLVDFRITGEIPGLNTKVTTSLVAGQAPQLIDLSVFDIYIGVGFKIGFYNRLQEDEGL